VSEDATVAPARAAYVVAIVTREQEDLVAALPVPDDDGNAVCVLDPFWEVPEILNFIGGPP
jgi:hypothetical protein